MSERQALRRWLAASCQACDPVTRVAHQLDGPVEWAWREPTGHWSWPHRRPVTRCTTCDDTGVAA